MRYLVMVVWMALAGAVATPAAAQVSFGFSSPGVSIGINVPVYPRLVRVPGYPVYYAPGVDTNYFFYDGLYWVFQNDSWYSSDWYNGPWQLVPPDAVPLYVLRVPVRYYRYQPSYFHGWALNLAPRWGEHWGRGWEDQHRDWNRWDRARAPAPAPLPSYQRNFAGNRYPRAEEQARERERNYRYQPRDNAARQHYEQRQSPQARQQHQAPQARQVPQAREQRQAPQAREQRQAPQAREQRQAPQAREQRQAPQAREQRQAPQAREQGKGGTGPTQKDAERWGAGG